MSTPPKPPSLPQPSRLSQGPCLSSLNHTANSHWETLMLGKIGGTRRRGRQRMRWLDGMFIGRTDAEAEASILWPPDVKSRLIGKDPDAGKDWGHEEKGTTEDEMVGWHHWLNGHKFKQTLGSSEGQGGLACCCLWDCKESDTTERLIWSVLIWIYIVKFLSRRLSQLVFPPESSESAYFSKSCPTDP